MSTRKTGTVDMLNGSLMKNIWLFAIPLMFTNFMQTMFQAADQVVVGKFAGQQALAAVGATGSLCFLIISLFSGISMGSNVIIARYLGAGNTEKVGKAVHTTVTLALICGVFLTILGYVLSRPMLELMSTPSDIIDMSVLYMRLYFFGSMFGITNFFGGSILRAKGDTKRPMYFLMISGATNVILNLIFVIVLQMGVAGVAWATVISQAMGATLVISTLCRQKDVTHLDLKKLGVDKHVAWEIIKIGVPAGLQSMVFSLSNVVIQSSINSFDSSAIVAGNSAAQNVEGFVYIGMQGFTQACMTFTSQNIGAKRYERITEIMKLTMKLTLICTAIISVTVWFFGE
ncbi:MAG: MATE family efflux transporter, partial [Clostridia bacterium]|nr:MATE family efflux transporter [Clostridia bacterium]